MAQGVVNDKEILGNQGRRGQRRQELPKPVGTSNQYLKMSVGRLREVTVAGPRLGACL